MTDLFFMEDHLIEGAKGDESHTPVETPTSAQANTYAKLIDLICEGEIGGPANNNSWYQSTYYNEIPVQNPDGSYNYNGMIIEGRNGTSTQIPLTDVEGIQNTISVGVPVTTASTVSRTIGATGDEVYIDKFKVTLSIPALFESLDNGDINKTSVNLELYITPNNGQGTQVLVGSYTIFEKFTTEYRKQFTIENIRQYGSGPWLITIKRITPDSGSAKLVNSTTWYSYTTIINTKLNYYERCVVGHSINGQAFGNQIPNRAYRINGRKIKIPNNYDPINHTYSGDWSGSFTTGVTNNPAWIVYDLLTDPDVGLGLIISEAMVDKWSLYATSVYNDGMITVTSRSLTQSLQNINSGYFDGGYADTTSTESRFTFNGVIESRSQAMDAIVALCGVMRCNLAWYGGQIIFIQDRPNISPARPVSPSNISQEGFNYTGIAKRDRTSVIKISWNNPDTLGKLDVIEIVDEPTIIKFGYNELDIGAYGCTSKTEAIRRGRYILDTNIYARELVSFKGGIEWADALPGELISVQDPNFAGRILEGRVKSGTTTSIVTDKPIVLESGVTYKILIQTPYNDGTKCVEGFERTITNSSGTYTTLNFSSVPLAPIKDAIFVLSGTNLVTRLFTIISVKESNEWFEISGVEYDATKYDRVEYGIVVEQPPTTIFSATSLEPPTNLVVEGYTYTEGDPPSRFFGIQIGWTPSIDPRTEYYELQYKLTTTEWNSLTETASCNYNWKNVVGELYDIRVRGVGVGIYSEWLTYTGYALDAGLSGLAPPTNLRTKDGNGIFNGRDCTILWDLSTGHLYNGSEVGSSNVAYYKVEVRKPDTTLLRTFNTAKDATEYTYTYAMNVDDHNGTPSRDLLFYVFSVDTSGQSSTMYGTLNASNPAPTMASSKPDIINKFGYLKVEWDLVSDNDMDYYRIYMDSSSTNPITEVGLVKHPGTSVDVSDVSYNTDYYAKVVPYDLFGIGIGSIVSDVGNTLKIPMESVAIELSSSIVMSDSTGRTDDQLSSLYDGTLSSGGITYSGGGWAWIEYDMGVENFINGLQIHASTAVNVYASYKRSSDDSWNWMSGNTTHALDIVQDQLRMTSRTTETLCQSNYWTTKSGFDYAFFPNGEVARYCRLYIQASGVTINEMKFRRIVIAEDIAVEQLSAITIDAGLITAGILRSSNFDATHGCEIDLDDGTISGTITFQSGSAGYANIADKPVSLSEIDQQAFNDIATAQETADGKINSYYQTSAPTGMVAGDVGDLWFDTDDGNKLYRWSGTTWEISQDTKIGTAISNASTADDKAVAAQGTANTALSTANTAATNATNANNLLADIANDNKLTATEKQETKKEWDIIVSEKTGIDSQADSFGVSKTTYDSNYTTLSNYITPLLSTLTTTSDIVGTTFRTNFKNYYDARTTLLNAVTTAAQILANTKITTFYTSSTPTALKVGDIWYNSSTHVVRIATAAGTGGWGTQTVADAISGQGDLATLSSLSYSALTGTKPPIDADKTSSNTAAGFLNQGALATLNTIGSSQVTAIDASKITTGTLGASVVYAGTIAANKISAGSLASNVINTGALNADNITTGTLNANKITAGSITVGNMGAYSTSYCQAVATDANISCPANVWTNVCGDVWIEEYSAAAQGKVFLMYNCTVNGYEVNQNGAGPTVQFAVKRNNAAGQIYLTAMNCYIATPFSFGLVVAATAIGGVPYAVWVTTNYVTTITRQVFSVNSFKV